MGLRKDIQEIKKNVQLIKEDLTTETVEKLESMMN